jgi:release factor glutamine methyltransferase
MTSEVLKIKDVLDKTTAFFKQKNFSSPRLDAELILAEALKIRRLDLYLKFDQPLQETELQKCREFVKRRSQGEPVAYILGRREFYGLAFSVSPHVLIPRPETEILVEKVLEFVKELKVPPRILDLGTGSGCIALSLLKNCPGAQALMVDISDGALQVAKQNAEALGLLDRCEFLQWNASLALPPECGSFDIIVGNPPYIAPNDPDVEPGVKNFEPASALFAQEEGLEFIRAWSASQAPYLAANSMMIFEMGSKQALAAEKIFSDLKVFSKILLVQDLAGFDRHIVGYCQKQEE